MRILPKLGCALACFFGGEPASSPFRSSTFHVALRLRARGFLTASGEGSVGSGFGFLVYDRFCLGASVGMVVGAEVGP